MPKQIAGSVWGKQPGGEPVREQLCIGEEAVEETALSQALQDNYSPLAGFPFLIFVLLYLPCVAAMGAIKQEFGSRWAWSAAIYQTLIALLASILIYQGGRFLGLG